MAIQKIHQEIVDLGAVKSFSIIGDPGCEGLGTTMMEVYAHALATSAIDEFILVVGDFVPEGTARFYKAITGLTNAIAENPVYALRGNHDTGEYDDYFGLHNYALKTQDFTIVVLDNALRKFEPDGLALLERILSDDTVKNVIIAFHIPIPNNYTKNAVKQEEYEKLKAIYEPYKAKVNYFLCGHVHSRFIDQIDGIPFICTGGGGAMIEDVSENIHAADVNYHVIKFEFENGALHYRVVDLEHTMYGRENSNPIVKGKLLETIQGEMMAHLRYLVFAERAQRRGYEKIANLFRALAESEYRHAHSFFAIYDRAKSFSKTIPEFVPVEDFEYKHLYKMMRDYAKEEDLPLIRQAYTAASVAEQIHSDLLKEATDMDDFAQDDFYVCSVCGYLMNASNKEARCPVCGSPARQYIEFTSNSATKEIY